MNFKYIQALMNVIITCQYEKDLTNQLLKRFSIAANQVWYKGEETRYFCFLSEETCNAYIQSRVNAVNFSI